MTQKYSFQIALSGLVLAAAMGAAPMTAEASQMPQWDSAAAPFDFGAEVVARRGRGADDAPGDDRGGRRGRGADDGANHTWNDMLPLDEYARRGRGRGADDAPGDDRGGRRGRGADDGPNHTWNWALPEEQFARRGRGADDAPGDDRGRGGRGKDDGANHT